MTITSSIMIEAPVERVFATFTDLELLQKTVQGIEKLEILEQPKFGVGTKWRETRVMMGKEATEVMWVTDLEPNKSYSIGAESHGTKYLSVYNFTETDEGAEVSMSFTGTPMTTMAKVFSGLAFLFKGSLEKQLHKDMEDLKAELEK